jgi:hypothetical protein
MAADKPDALSTPDPVPGEDVVIPEQPAPTPEDPAPAEADPPGEPVDVEDAAEPAE